MDDIKRIDTYLFFNLFTIIEFLFISLFFKQLYKSKRSKKILVLTLISFSIYFVIDFATSGTYVSDFASWPATIESIILISFSIYFLFEQINNTDSIFIYSKKPFWLVVAIFIYLAGTFFLFIFAQKNLNDDVFLKQYALMNSVLYIVKNVIISIAFIIKESQDDLLLSDFHFSISKREDPINFES